MIDILDLPSLEVIDRRVDPFSKSCYLEAKLAYTQEDCPHCSSQCILYKHAKRRQTYRDVPIRGCRTVISLNVQRFYCRNCGKTFMQRLPWMDPTRMMTTRCLEWIKERSLHDSYAEIAEEVGCAERTVRNIAYDYLAFLNDRYRPTLPERLGIDEIAVGGRYRCVLTDVHNRRVVDLLHDRDKLTVAKWLWEHRSSKLKLVTMDMWRPFQIAVVDVFEGKVPVVVDKFHVLRMANQAVDDARVKLSAGLNKKERAKWFNNRGLLRARNHIFSQDSLVRTKLETWLLNNPELATAYYLKEGFFNVYDQTSRHDAERALDAWRHSVQEPMKDYFGDLLRATKNWRPEIMNYFDYRDVTNAFTESLNNQTRVVDRQGRGYDFEVLRGRMLFGRQADMLSPHSSGTLKRVINWEHPEVPVRHEHSQPPSSAGELENSKSVHEILFTQNALVSKYGDHCPACGGQLEQKLQEFYQSLPKESQPLVTTGFSLVCVKCKAPFGPSIGEDRFQPANPKSHSEVASVKGKAPKRAMDLRHLRDSSVLPPGPKIRKRRRPRNPPRPVPTPKPQPGEETYTLDPDAESIA